MAYYQKRVNIYKLLDDIISTNNIKLVPHFSSLYSLGLKMQSIRLPQRLKPQVIYKQKCITHYVCIHAVITLLALFRVKNIFMRDRANTKYADTSYNFFKEIFLYF